LRFCPKIGSIVFLLEKIHPLPPLFEGKRGDEDEEISYLETLVNKVLVG
jgi:hypothetical protein